MTPPQPASRLTPEERATIERIAREASGARERFRRELDNLRAHLQRLPTKDESPPEDRGPKS